MKSCFGGQKRSRVSDLSGVVISVITTLCASMDEVNYKSHFGSRELTETMDSLVKKKQKQLNSACDEFRLKAPRKRNHMLSVGLSVHCICLAPPIPFKIVWQQEVGQ